MSLTRSGDQVKYSVNRIGDHAARTGDRERMKFRPEAETRLMDVLMLPTARAVHEIVTQQGEADHSQLAKATNVSLTTVGRVAARLERAGLVTQTRVGRRVIVRSSTPLGT